MRLLLKNESRREACFATVTARTGNKADSLHLPITPAEYKKQLNNKHERLQLKPRLRPSMDTEVATHSDFFLYQSQFIQQTMKQPWDIAHTQASYAKNLTLKCTASSLRRTRLHRQLKLRQHSYKCTKKHIWPMKVWRIQYHQVHHLYTKIQGSV